MSLTVLTGFWGCATTDFRPNLLPPLPSEELRNQLGTIAVVSTYIKPETQFIEPARGAAAGLIKGAEGGALVGGLIGGYIGYGTATLAPPLSIVLFPAGLVGGAALGMIPGGIYGAATALPPETIDQAETTLRHAVTELKVDDSMRSHIIQFIRDETNYNVFSGNGPDVTDTDSETNYRAWAELGVTTLLEVSVTAIWLGAIPGADPPMVMGMAVRSSLISASNGETLTYNTTVYQSPESHRFTDWAADNAALFHGECTQGGRLLAEKTVEDLFLIYPIPGRG